MLKFVCDPKSQSLKPLINFFQPTIVPSATESRNIEVPDNVYTYILENVGKINSPKDEEQYRALTKHLGNFTRADQIVSKYWLRTLLAEINTHNKCRFETLKDAHLRYFENVKEYLYTNQDKYADNLEFKLMLTQIRLIQEFRGYSLLKKSSLPLKNNTFRQDLPLDKLHLIKSSRFIFHQVVQDYLIQAHDEESKHIVQIQKYPSTGWDQTYMLFATHLMRTKFPLYQIRLVFLDDVNDIEVLSKTFQ